MLNLDRTTQARCQNLFAVIYRGSVYPELEKEYQALGGQITEHFMTHIGAVGSCHHKTERA